MASEKPLTKEISVFVKHHLRDKYAFAPFTGQDFSAWAAFLYACQLYGRSDGRGREQAVLSMAALVRAAQQKADVLAVFKKAIPGVLDWNFEPEVWAQIAPRTLERSPGCPRRIIRCEQIGLPMREGDDMGRIALVWPCEDGAYECPHLHSKPSKRHEGDLECRDCKATWRPAKAS